MENILSDIVGKASLSIREEELQAYSRDLSFMKGSVPFAVVRPHSRGEIQEIVRAANREGFALVPVSSAPPHFRGDTVPQVGEAVIVDLSEMKRIIRVDGRHKVALMEPGVTFEELIPELERAGLRPNMPLMPKPGKSVVASVLEREPPIMPKYHWDNSDPLACLEVVFGTGDIFRTGSAAGPGSLEEQWEQGEFQKIAEGPGQASFHRLVQGAQGCIGIVTWGSIRCARIPIIEEPFFVASRDIRNMVELAYWLIRLRLVDECMLLNQVNLSKLIDPAHSEEASPKLWVLFFNITSTSAYFPEEQISQKVEDAKEVCKRAGLEMGKAYMGLSAEAFLRRVRNPFTGQCWKQGDGQVSYDVFFLTSRQRIETLIDLVLSVVLDEPCRPVEIGIYVQPVVQGTCWHLEFNLFVDPSLIAPLSPLADLVCRLVRLLLQNGAFFSRPYDIWAPLVVNGDAASFFAMKRVKSIFDPKGIMNPGKLNLW